jgi:hypothetical protein
MGHHTRLSRAAGGLAAARHRYATPGNPQPPSLGTVPALAIAYFTTPQMFIATRRACPHAARL